MNAYLNRIFHNKCVDQARKNSSNIRMVHDTLPWADLLYQIPDAARHESDSLLKNDHIQLRQLKMGKIQDAVASFKKVIEDNSTNYLSKPYLGITYLRLNDYDK